MTTMLSEEYGNRYQPQLDPQPEQPACPRCDSIDTKFCYYNNYNLSQPRHYCKSCRRYWTRGGSLRNVPVGGSKRSRTESPPKDSTQTESASDTKSSTTNLNLNDSVCGETWHVEGGVYYVG